MNKVLEFLGTDYVVSYKTWMRLVFDILILVGMLVFQMWILAAFYGVITVIVHWIGVHQFNKGVRERIEYYNVNE
jgi:hypothetical protein